MVYQLAEEYIRLGHEVTLLAGPNSTCSGQTICFGENTLSKGRLASLKEVLYVWKFIFLNRNKFDLVHSFGRLIYLLPILNHPIRKIMSYQREVTPESTALIDGLPNKNMLFTGCSNYISEKPGLKGNWQAVYNFVNLDNQKFSEKVAESAPLVFLGRLDRIKGCHHCIRLAKMLKHDLVIAGNISDIPHERAYFEEEIKPYIDGRTIKYVGPVDDFQKNQLLSNAKALLMLLDWNEPFGIVMVEALACGTPIVGFPKGAVSEIIVSGVNGLLLDSDRLHEDLLSRINLLDRNKCRESVEGKFELTGIAHKYLNLHNSSTVVSAY